MRAVLTLFCIGLLCGTALADTPNAPLASAPTTPLTPQAPAPLDDATGTSLAAIFNDLCVGGFPDDTALEARIAAKTATPMTPDQVKALLHDDPGRGWVVVQDAHRFAVTEEFPPFRACSVRVNTPAGVPTLGLGKIITDATAKSGQHAGAAMTIPTPPAAQNPQMQIRAVMVPLSPLPAGADAENFMAFVTTYRDKVTNAVLIVENRFVHQIHSSVAH